MRIKLGMLGTDRSIDVTDLVTFRSDKLNDLLEDDLTVHIERVGRRVGEVITDVAHVGSAQQRIADSMDKHIGIAVAQEPHRVQNLNTA